MKHRHSSVPICAALADTAVVGPLLTIAVWNMLRPSPGVLAERCLILEYVPHVPVPATNDIIVQKQPLEKPLFYFFPERTDQYPLI